MPEQIEPVRITTPDGAFLGTVAIGHYGSVETVVRFDASHVDYSFSLNDVKSKKWTVLALHVPETMSKWHLAAVKFANGDDTSAEWLRHVDRAIASGIVEANEEIRKIEEKIGNTVGVQRRELEDDKDDLITKLRRLDYEAKDVKASLPEAEEPVSQPSP